MSNISVANGWQHILAEAVGEANALPEEWLFEMSAVERIDGALKISATYNSFDVPLDDHLPADKKLPHPWRALQQIRENARLKSLSTCECCGREGKLVDAGKNARVRCVRHEHVLDAAEWSGNPVGAMFDSAEEAMGHFLEDYAKGIDMMKDLAAAGDEEQDSGETKS